MIIDEILSKTEDTTVTDGFEYALSDVSADCPNQ